MEKETVDFEYVLNKIRNNEPVKDCFVSGLVNLNSEQLLETRSSLNYEINFQDCIIEKIVGVNLELHKKITLKNCKVQFADFKFSYFYGGLDFDSCEFESEIDFQCGGHNKPENEIRFDRCIFKDYVSFFDCIYEGPLTITNCDFEKGTNLYGPNCMTDLGPKPLIRNNIGNLEIDKG